MQVLIRRHKLHPSSTDPQQKLFSMSKYLSFFLLLVVAAATDAFATEKPKWWSPDYKSKTHWGFFCEASSTNETEALALARANCAVKMCQLFGVEIDSQNSVKETLKDVNVESTVVERCPKVRVVGRSEKRKSVNCDEEDSCLAFVEQLYPIEEYEKEHKRLNSPKIVKEFERTIVIRENDQVFKDPKECKIELQKFSMIRGERVSEATLRIAALEEAQKKCISLDYRDVPLQNELHSYISKSVQTRDISAATMIAKVMMNEASIEKKLLALLSFEKDRLAAEPKIQPLKNWIAKNFDYLTFRYSYIPESQEYALSNGVKSKTNPYLDELANCQKQRELLLKWPKGLASDLPVCVAKLNAKDGNDCYNFSILMLRASYVSCVCRAGKAENVQACSQVLSQFLDDSCPSEVNDSCMKGFIQYSTERLKLNKI